MKEKDKILILKTLLNATFVMICISVILKLLGFNVFGVDTTNRILINITNFIRNNKLDLILDFLLLFFQTYIFFKLTCLNTSKGIYYISSVVCTLFNLIFQKYINAILNLQGSVNGTIIYFLFSFLFLIVFCIIIDLKVPMKKENFKINVKNFVKSKILRPILVGLTLSLYQIIVMFLRNVTSIDRFNFLYDFLLNFDYMILLLATYYLFYKKENKLKYNGGLEFSLPKLLDEKPEINNFKNFINKLKDIKKEYLKMNKEEKIIFILYAFFFIMSELFNLGLIIVVAYLNHVLIECFFIIIAFIISRKVFGAFHLDSAIKCWLMSNISFFLLSKLTINVGTTFVVPILCGIALSYITSKFIKNNNKELYRGISEEDLIKICENRKLTELELNIIKDFYCNKMSLNKMTFKYHYSDRTLRRYKTRALEKINQGD
jgi:hypothetical protein